MKSILLVSLLVLMLLITKANAQTEEIFYYPKLPQVEMSVAKRNLEYVLKTGNLYKNSIWVGKPEEVAVFDDRFELTYKKPKNILTFYFSDLSKYPLNVVRVHNTNTERITWTDEWRYELRLGELIFNVSKYAEGWILPDNLYFFQQQLNEKLFRSQLVLFESVAAQYRALQVKPPVSEGQRKLIVQANVLNQQKMYDKAIEIYNKANEVDQTSYPAAYSNLALLSAQLHKFDAAIYYMKKYLMLEPGASDARGAQDKIYEWEILMQK